MLKELQLVIIVIVLAFTEAQQLINFGQLSDKLKHIKYVFPPKTTFACGIQGRSSFRPIEFRKRRSISDDLIEHLTKREDLSTGREKRSSFGLTEIERGVDIFTPEVVGGENALRSSWPWMALFWRRYGREIDYFCDGVLINEAYVLTAAHCILDPSSFTVRLGEHNFGSIYDSANPINIEVEKLIFYPHYKLNQGHHDLGLVKLAHKIRTTNDIRPICLPWGTPSNAQLVGTKVTVTGWGSTVFGGPSSRILQEVQITVFKSSDCQKSYSTLSDYASTFPEGMTSKNILCAGDKAGGKDACNGDSGGPLVHRSRGKWTLAGIVSKGYGCGHKDYHGIYAPIRNIEYLQWIKDNAFT